MKLKRTCGRFAIAHISKSKYEAIIDPLASIADMLYFNSDGE